MFWPENCPVMPLPLSDKPIASGATAALANARSSHAPATTSNGSLAIETHGREQSRVSVNFLNIRPRLPLESRADTAHSATLNFLNIRPARPVQRRPETAPPATLNFLNIRA